jgi:DNA-directed RNA polymerase specialized sigma subunit
VADDDAKKILQWQKTNDPTLLNELTIRYQPIVHSIVNRYSAIGVSPATLRAQAHAQLFKSFKNYDPDKGAAPSTHIWNNLQKITRTAMESQMSGHIPEYRNLKRSSYMTVKQNLIDRQGYEPNTAQMADELGWSQKEVGRMENELGGEITASKAEFDFYGNSTTGESTDKILSDYLYHELNDKEKVIFEHTFGYGGKKILNNKELAKRLNTNEMAIHRMKKKMSKQIQEYR